MSYQVGPINNYQYVSANIENSSNQIIVQDASMLTSVRRDIYSEYNFFISQYNEDCNRWGENYLKNIPISRSVHSCTRCIIFCFLFSNCPVVSVPIFFFMLYRLIILIRITIIVNHNRDLVPNPLDRMVYCSGLKFTNSFIDISSTSTYEQLSYFGLSTNDFEAFHLRYSSQISQGSIRVMLYNDIFQNYESNVLKYMYLKIYFTGYIVFGSFCGIIGTIFLYIRLS